MKNSNQDKQVNITPDALDLNSEQQEERRQALRSMLAATEARQQHMKRSRRQPLAAGLLISVRSGDNIGTKGTILDADYIHNRVFVDFHDGEEGEWLEFSQVKPFSSGPDNESDT